ncbi:MAG: hypothetical protein QM742_03175 [Aquabacterium sp.]
MTRDQSPSVCNSQKDQSAPASPRARNTGSVHTHEKARNSPACGTKPARCSSGSMSCLRSVQLEVLDTLALGLADDAPQQGSQGLIAM